MNVGAAHAAFEVAPEVFHPVDVNIGTSAKVVRPDINARGCGSRSDDPTYLSLLSHSAGLRPYGLRHAG